VEHRIWCCFGQADTPEEDEAKPLDMLRRLTDRRSPLGVVRFVVIEVKYVRAAGRRSSDRPSTVAQLLGFVLPMSSGQ
jgi:hypothetical protein